MEITPADFGARAAARDNQKKPIVILSGMDGNAFAILGRVREVLKWAGLENQIKPYLEEATAGDYDNLIHVTMKYVEVV